MSHVGLSCPSWPNSNEQRNQQSFSKNLGLRVCSSLQLCQSMKHFGFQLQDHDSSSTQSTSQSHQELGAIGGGSNSQDQCVSSESGQEESYGKLSEGQMKPVFFVGNPELVFNPSQVECSHSMIRVPYPYADPYFAGGLLTAYGPQTVIQAQMMGMAPVRVPLPLDIAEDGPIYVNAKQYHGILRRRQSRAKLEAQSKLIKARKPYLHESRHRHALNRLRGSGGRFLSTKKLQQADPIPTSGNRCVLESANLHNSEVASEFGGHQAETGKCDVSSTSYSNGSDKGSFFQPPDRRFLGISPRMGGATMQGSGGLMRNGTQQCAPVVR